MLRKFLLVEIFFFFLMKRQPPISTLFPYTTLFRGSSARKPSRTARKERSRKPAKKMPAERAPPPRRTKKDPQGFLSYIRSSPSPARREKPPGNIRQKMPPG